MKTSRKSFVGFKKNKIKVVNKIFALKYENNKLNLKDKNKFIGFRGNDRLPSGVILKNNNLHVEIIINPNAF